MISNMNHEKKSEKLVNKRDENKNFSYLEFLPGEELDVLASIR